MFNIIKQRKAFIKDEAKKAELEGNVTCLNCKYAHVFPNHSTSLINEAFCKVKKQTVKCYSIKCVYYKAKLL